MTQDECVDIVQQINNLLAIVCTLIIHSFIIFRIKSKFSVYTQYQNLLILQSVTYILGSIARLIVNSRITLDGDELRGYAFISMPELVDNMLEYVVDFLDSGEPIVLAVFNIYRVLHFVRPSFLKPFYSAIIPIGILCCICYAYVNVNDTGYAYYFNLLFFIIICSVIIMCYAILRKHFALNTFSERVRKLQTKLSKGILLQILIHAVILALMSLVSPAMLLFDLVIENIETRRVVFGVYILVVCLIFSWYPVSTGLIIRWSIMGFLTRKKPKKPPTSTVFLSQVEAVGHTAKARNRASRLRCLKLQRRQIS